MSKTSKYSHLTEQDVRDGLKEGKYKDAGTVIKDVETGQVVKHLPTTVTATPSFFLPTFIQVNNNIIYQADISPILNQIEENKINDLLDGLENEYNIILDYLHDYRTYNNKLSELNEQCLKTSVNFDSGVRKYVSKINNELEECRGQNKLCHKDELEETNIDHFVQFLNAYLDIIFLYIISEFLLYKDKFKKEQKIISKILSLEQTLRNFYEQIVAPSNYDSVKKCHQIDMKKSIYPMYLFDKQYDNSKLNEIIKHDRRFEDLLSVVDFFKRLHNKQDKKLYLESCYYEYNNAPLPDKSLGFSINTDNINVENKRHQLILKLIEILDKIENLKKLREEISEIEIDFDDEIFEKIKIGFFS